jgi:hypothetical protein
MHRPLSMWMFSPGDVARQLQSEAEDLEVVDKAE